MNYSILNGEITVFGTDDFNPKHIFDCGQVFRYEKNSDFYKIFTKNVCCRLNFENDRVIINTTDTEYAKNYFDLDTDYSYIKRELSKSNDLKQAVAFGSGIRILKQDPFETLISFIVSANNNIPRIKGILNRLTEAYGEDMGDFRAFPTAEGLASAKESFFSEIGCGYRAAYIVRTVAAINAGFDLNALFGLDTASAKKELLTLMGVGPKVADCILLFAFHKTDVFPVDVWSERIYKGMGFPETDSTTLMATRLTERFGALSGYAQQYLYYYYRENKIL